MISSNVTIFSDDHTFEKKVFEVFEFQYINNLVFRRFCDFFGKQPLNIDNLQDIPLLPVEAFRDTTVSSMLRSEPELIFKSSGTTSAKRSVHNIISEEMYRESIYKGIQYFYNLDKYAVWGYTPGYDENPDSSLIWMVRELIRRDKSGLSHFLSINAPIKYDQIGKVMMAKKQIMIFGAAFGLLDLVNEFPTELPPGSIVLETGGMKTHKRSISRSDLHARLATGFSLSENQIHSEYGMTELLSQAYAQGNEWFRCPPWMSVTIRNPRNPFQVLKEGEEGVIGIIDLANFYSCSFLLTADKGVSGENNSFKVTGRYHEKNLRGCNFLVDKE